VSCLALSVILPYPLKAAGSLSLVGLALSCPCLALVLSYFQSVLSDLTLFIFCLEVKAADSTLATSAAKREGGGRDDKDEEANRRQKGSSVNMSNSNMSKAKTQDNARQDSKKDTKKLGKDKRAFLREGGVYKGKDISRTQKNLSKSMSNGWCL
jgi:hypothetical protein